MTAQNSLALQIADALAACGIPYLLSGSFASNFWGIPRSTKDADFVIHLSRGVGSDFAGRLGPDFELDPQLSFETVTGTHRQLIHHRNSVFKIEIFLLSNDRTTRNDLRVVVKRTYSGEGFGCYQQRIQSSASSVGHGQKMPMTFET